MLSNGRGRRRGERETRPLGRRGGLSSREDLSEHAPDLSAYQFSRPSPGPDACAVRGRASRLAPRCVVSGLPGLRDGAPAKDHVVDSREYIACRSRSRGEWVLLVPDAGATTPSIPRSGGYLTASMVSPRRRVSRRRPAPAAGGSSPRAPSPSPGDLRRSRPLRRGPRRC